jgi:hypothetical protein
MPAKNWRYPVFGLALQLITDRRLFYFLEYSLDKALVFVWLENSVRALHFLGKCIVTEMAVKCSKGPILPIVIL